MDKRKRNNQSSAQRRAAIYRRRKTTTRRARARGAKMAARLEAAKTVLRRHHSDVFDAGLADSRFRGLIYVGERRYTPEQVIEMAAAILQREEARNRELRAQYGLKEKR